MTLPRGTCRRLVLAARRSTIASFVVALSGPALAAAQSTPDSAGRTTTVLAAGAHYRAGWLHELVLGANYRALWVTPIRVEVLNLREYAGGLRPTKRGGGLQTRSLRFQGADGKEYVFRSVDKNPAAVLPAELQETFARSVVQDLTSIGHPAGAVVVAPLLRAAGVLHAPPQLVVLPKDDQLGSFRSEFAGLLGTIEERPDEGDEGVAFEGAAEVVGTPEVFKRVEARQTDRVDAREFLAARLLDLFLGDWDRHLDQWRWAKFGTGAAARWRPIPRDRDMAFARIEGLLPPLGRFRYPQLVSFSADYPNMVGLTWQARALDRRFLSELDWPVWDSVAAALRERLTDSVIDAAVRDMPTEYHPLEAERMTRALKARRDRLAEAAERFFRVLAHQADVHTTDDDELAEITRVDDRYVDLTVHRRAVGESSGEPYLRRRFDRATTRELRVYLHGGQDRIVVRGERPADMTVHIVGGGGDDEFIDSVRTGGPGARYYDGRGNDRISSISGASIDRRPYTAPVDPKRPDDPHRDWGRKIEPAPWLGFSPDIGLTIGGGPTVYRYGFRQKPYASRMTLRVGYATGAQKFRADYTAEFYRPNSALGASVQARASGIEIVRFHGFGNENPAPESRDFYKAEQAQYALEPAVMLSLGSRARLSLGPTLKYARTRLDPSTFIGATRPYGVGSFGQVGGRVLFGFDSRDVPGAPTRGFLLTTEGSAYPGVWDAEEAFGAVDVKAATYLTAARLRSTPTLALRVGGKRVWGTYPFHEAAFVGGSSTLRGWSEQRFAGDASLYGNAELRLFLTKFFFVLPGELGVFGLADVGRVYLDGESSDAWHTGAGGGLWVAFLNRANTLSLAVAKSEERTGVYLRLGFLF